MFDLGHDVFGQRSGEPFGALGVVLGEEHDARGQAGIPLVLADGVEETAEQADVAALPLGVIGVVGVQVGQVALQDAAVEPDQDLDVGVLVEEDREAGESGDGTADGLIGQAAGGIVRPVADLVRAPLAFRRGRMVTVMAAAAMSSCRSPSASPMRIPVS